MKFTIAKNQLSQTVSIVAKGMSSRSTLPIFAGIFMEAASDGVVFQTTDLEIAVKHATEALVERSGATVVSGKLFQDIVKSLPEAAVTVELDSGKLSITCMDSSFTIATMEPGDFPAFPHIIPEKIVQLPTKALGTAVKKVIKAISKDESRAVLTGVDMRINDKTLQLVATDSYRLAISRVPLDNPAESAMELIVPGSILDEVTKLSAGEESVSVGESENQILFQFGNTTLVSRKIEGNYPNFEQIIPKQHSVEARLKSSEILDAVRQAAILAHNHGSVQFIIDSEAGLLNVSSKAQDVGEGSIKVNADISGDSFTIGFNHQYILDGLSAADTEEIDFEAQNPSKPGIFKSGSEDDLYFYLTMPVRLD